MFNNDEIKEYNISLELHEDCITCDMVGRYKFKDQYRYVEVRPPMDGSNFYFRIFDSDFEWNSTKCARINLLDSNYIRCNDSYLPEWFLDIDEISELIKFLQSPVTRSLYSNCKNNWELIIFLYNNLLEIEELDFRIVTNISMPNYINLLNNII